MKRFLRETELSRQLEHPNIVKTLDAGVEQSIPYIVMEYIQGIPLHKFLQQNSLSFSEKLLLIKSIAEALDYSHKKGIIHRDIKPSNIMITNDQRPILMDFGLARSNRVSDKRLTITGEVLGTPKYMSPEQARGEKN